jgi:peptidyl-prolyl cis-trans isomerase SurA
MRSKIQIGDFMNKWMVVGMILLGAGSFGCAKQTRQDPNVAARVNGKNILRSEVDKYYNFKIQEAPQKPSGEAATLAKMEVVRDLIEREMMAQKAEQLKLSVKEAEIEAQMKQLQGGASPDEFHKDLERRGFSEQDMRNEVRRSLTMQMLVEDQVNSKVQITDAEVTSFYDENKASFNIPETQYHIGQIVVTSNPSTPVANSRNDKALNAEQAAAKIKRIVGSLQAGQDFQQLAQQFSEDPQTAREGGDLGFQPVAALDRLGPQLKQTIIKMKAGDLSPVVQIQDAFLILKLFGKREPGQKTLEDPEVNQSIRTELRNRKQQLLSAAFSEQMRNEARVENFMAQEVLARFKK